MKLTCILHLWHAAFVKNKLSNILTENDYIRSYCYFSSFFGLDQSDFSFEVNLIYDKKNRRS